MRVMTIHSYVMYKFIFSSSPPLAHHLNTSWLKSPPLLVLSRLEDAGTPDIQALMTSWQSGIIRSFMPASAPA